MDEELTQFFHGALQLLVQEFLKAGVPSCHPTSSVKALVK